MSKPTLNSALIFHDFKVNPNENLFKFAINCLHNLTSFSTMSDWKYLVKLYLLSTDCSLVIKMCSCQPHRHFDPIFKSLYLITQHFSNQFNQSPFSLFPMRCGTCRYLLLFFELWYHQNLNFCYDWDKLKNFCNCQYVIINFVINLWRK